jgi:hypothetical protein
MDDQDVEPGLVRARRIEIVDSDGRVRAVLGDLPGPPGPAPGSFGIELLDPGGRPRLWVALEPLGPAIALDVDGNIGVQIGVTDDVGDAAGAAAYVVVADARGAARRGWRVDADGSVTTWDDE